MPGTLKTGFYLVDAASRDVISGPFDTFDSAMVARAALPHNQQHATGILWIDNFAWGESPP